MFWSIGRKSKTQSHKTSPQTSSTVASNKAILAAIFNKGVEPVKVSILLDDLKKLLQLSTCTALGPIMRTLTQETSLCQGQPSCLVTFGVVHLERLRVLGKFWPSALTGTQHYCMVYKLVLLILNDSNPPCVLHVDTPSKHTGGALVRFLERHRHSERMKMFGPFTMGIGIFIFICANAILHENRDRETKVGLKASEIPAFPVFFEGLHAFQQAA